MIGRKAALTPSTGLAEAASVPAVFDGKYRLLRLVRGGSVDSVHEGESLVSGKRVCVKTLHAHVAGSEALRVRFIAEARANTQLCHPNVADIYDFGIDPAGTPYIVMELLPGETLQQLLARRGALSPALACEIMLQILAGLDAGHRLGLVHRDLKPCNIVVTHLGPDAPLVKILDFGIGKGGTEMLHRLEAPIYTAPEQLRSAEVGPLVDIYSAGVILYEMLAGEPPFTGDADQVLKQVALGHWKPLSMVNPAVPRLLALAVAAAMAVDPARRLLSAPLFARQLAPHVSHAPSHSAPYRPNSADAVLLHAASPMPEIKFMPTSDLTDLSRAPRDFPSLHLAKIAGTSKGESLNDSLLQSPVIPRAPTAPNIHSMGIREVETWSNAPAAMPVEPAGSNAPSEPSPGNPFMNDLADPLFDTLSGPVDPGSPDPRQVVAWQRGVLAAAVGVGAAAVLAWLYRFG